MRRLLTLLALPLLAACGHDFDHMQFDAIVTSDLGGHINSEELSVPEGLALKANIVAYNDDSETMPLTIRSQDTTIVDVENGVTDNAYTFIARRTGHTLLNFEADGHLVLTIAANITAQPSP